MKPTRSSSVITVVFPKIRAGWEQWILLRSDAHHDNLYCQQALERRHLQEAKRRGALICDFGDLFCAMQGKWDKRKDDTQLRRELIGNNYLDRLVTYNAAFYEPYADSFLMLAPGNHETANLKYHQTHLTERLAERLRQVRKRRGRSMSEDIRVGFDSDFSAAHKEQRDL